MPTCLFVVFVCGFGGLYELLARLFLADVRHNRLFHEVMRRSFFDGGERCDSLAIGGGELDAHGFGWNRCAWRTGLHGVTWCLLVATIVRRVLYRVKLNAPRGKPSVAMKLDFALHEQDGLASDINAVAAQLAQ